MSVCISCSMTRDSISNSVLLSCWVFLYIAVIQAEEVLFWSGKNRVYFCSITQPCPTLCSPIICSHYHHIYTCMHVYMQIYIQERGFTWTNDVNMQWTEKYDNLPSSTEVQKEILTIASVKWCIYLTVYWTSPHGYPLMANLIHLAQNWPHGLSPKICT